VSVTAKNDASQNVVEVDVVMAALWRSCLVLHEFRFGRYGDGRFVAVVTLGAHWAIVE
jgi:hypothetical protein